MHFVSIATSIIGVSAVILNGLFLPVILSQSPKAMGRYKWLMFLYTLAAFVYSICTLFTVPKMVLTEGGWLAYASWCPFSHLVESIFMSIFPVLILGFFIILEHMFAYRYCCVVEPQYIVYFRDVKSCSILVLIALLRIFLFAALPSILYLRDNQELKKLFSVVQSSITIYLDLQRTSYIGLPITVNNSQAPITTGLVILWGLNTLFAFGFFFIVSFQVINRFLHPDKMIQHSSRDRQHQKKIFILLIFQTLNPIVLTVVPLAFSYFFVFFEVEVNLFADLLPIFVSLPYLIDPILVAYVVPPYKTFCGVALERIFCIRQIIAPIYLY